MKFRSGQLLPSGATIVLLIAASLTLPACTDTAYVSGGNASYGDVTHYRVTGRYYHCHPSGVCHNSRHPNFFRHGGYQQRPQPPPARPRPY